MALFVKYFGSVEIYPLLQSVIGDIRRNNKRATGMEYIQADILEIRRIYQKQATINAAKEVEDVEDVEDVEEAQEILKDVIRARYKEIETKKTWYKDVEMAICNKTASLFLS